MMRMLQAPWFAAVLGTVAYLATMTAVMKLPPMTATQQAHSKAPPTPGNDPSWEFRNPEFEQWVNELKDEREALATRETQLKELLARIEAERTELFAATQAVAQLQAEFDRNVVRFSAQEDENLRREVKLLSAMPVDTAVKMLSTMTDEEAVRILIKMKTDQASQMLDTLSKSGKEESKRAATLMDRMRRSVPESGGKVAKTSS
jgi:flagellar motility protein MotE (MotC chaperone)